MMPCVSSLVVMRTIVGLTRVCRKFSGFGVLIFTIEKGLQVIVFRNGLSGMNAEHSPAEATMHDAVFGGPVFERMRQLGPW